jgi:uncharacterized protein
MRKLPQTTLGTASHSQWRVTYSMTPFAMIEVDDRQDYGEDRYNVIGLVEDHLLFVAYTLRSNRIRIISARLAEPHERRQYHEESR